MRKPALLALSSLLIHLPFGYAENDSDNAIVFHIKSEKQATAPDDETFTINFNNISITEYIRFVSKALNTNFTFNESELQFNITVVSEEPVSGRNILSALVQILRMHNLTLVEQENNYLITVNPDVHELGEVIIGDHMMDSEVPGALITRVFRLKNVPPSSVANIIRPMISAEALVEVSHETNQLIVTDVITNIEKISELLSAIDTPHTFMEVDTYTCRNLTPDEIIPLAEKILAPLSDGSQIQLIAQPGTETIYVVGSSFMVDKAMGLLEDLDTPQSARQMSAALEKAKRNQQQSLFVYKIENASPTQIQEALYSIAAELQTQKKWPDLIEAIQTMKWVPHTQSLIFSASPTVAAQLKEILASIDIPEKSAAALKAEEMMHSTFYLYQIQGNNPEKVEAGIHEMLRQLETTGTADPELIAALQSARYIPESHSLLFVGPQHVLNQIAAILPTFDQPSGPEEIFLYHPENISHAQLAEDLQRIAENLSDSIPADRKLKYTIDHMQWVDKSESLLFKGDTQTIERLKEILYGLDAERGQALGPHVFEIYKLKGVSGQVVLENLNQLASNLKSSRAPDTDLIEAIENIKWVKSSNTLLLTGPKKTVDQLKTLIAQFESEVEAKQGQYLSGEKTSYFIYKPKNLPADTVYESIRKLATDFEDAGLVDPQFIDALRTVKLQSATNSLLFTGSPSAIAQVRKVVEMVDRDEITDQIQNIDNLSFLIYKVEHMPAMQLLAAVRTFVGEQEKGTTFNSEVLNTLQTAKWISQSNSLVFTGPEEALKTILAILKKFDTPLPKVEEEEGVGEKTFVIYKPKYLRGEELIAILHEFEANLKAAGITDANLYFAINHVQWVPKTHSLLISGTPEAIASVEDLLMRFDIPSGNQVAVQEKAKVQGAADESGFLVYKLQYHQGNEIETALKEIGKELRQAGMNTNVIDTINSVQWISLTNSLIATGTPKALERVKELIQNLDVPLRQVLVEVLIIETTMDNSQNFGLQWGSKFQYLNKFALGTSNLSSNPPVDSIAANPLPGFDSVSSTYPPNAINNVLPTSSLSNAGLDLGSVGDIIFHKGKSFVTLASLLNALQKDEDTTILYNPKIIAQDNKTASLFVGENIPFEGSLVTISGNGTGLSSNSNIEYRDVGLNFSIKPIIGADGIVSIDVITDISAQIQNTTGTGNQLQGLQTSHTKIDTRVQVPDNHFVVLTGLINDKRTHFRSGIPCLGGLPVIGAAFTDNNRLNVRDNVIVFMKPRVITTYEEYTRLTTHQEDLFREQAGLPTLKEEFEAGIDILKDPEDD